MAIRKYKKPTAKDLAYNIVSLKQDIISLKHSVSVLDSIFNYYIDMKKDTKKFNEYLQSEMLKKAEEAKENE